MDAVILAAGRNARLTDYVPAFHKPLLPHTENTSLLRNAVVLAISQGVQHPVVVASPLNVYELNKDLAGLPVNFAIQRAPTGPGDALRVGLALNVISPSARVLVLLSDNTLTHDDVANICEGDGTAIGYRHMYRDDASRFTWWDPDYKLWREKETIPERMPPQVACWVGPFVGWRTEMEYVLRRAEPINGEYLIGPHLGAMIGRGKHIEVSSLDVGTEESYLDYMRRPRV